MITILGKEYPARLTELTISQWEKISNIYTRENGGFEGEKQHGAVISFVEIFRVIGVSEADLLEMKRRLPEKIFNEARSEFNKQSGEDTEAPNLSFELDGYTYKLPTYEDGFFITAEKRDLINEFVKKGKREGLASYITAVMYERTDLTENEHYDPAHIKHKAKIFKDQVEAIHCVPLMLSFLASENDMLKEEQELNESAGEEAGANA